MQDLKSVLIKRLYNFWATNNAKENATLLMQLNEIIDAEDRSGAETLCDWCRDDYEVYYKEHNITQEDIENSCGDINCGELDEIWDLCNWYLDYCNGQMSGVKLLELMGDEDNE